MIRRTKDELKLEEQWLKSIEQNLNKSAVQAAKADEDLFSKINNIINSKKPKFSSVSEAVEEMKERSGLNNYLRKKQQEKFANNTIMLFKKYPNIEQTFKNYIEDTGGYLPIPAVIEKVKSIYSSTVLEPEYWDDQNLIKYVVNLSLLEKAKKPQDKSEMNLGKNLYKNDSSDINDSNTDVFHSLTPASK
ncbi:MAG: hypothetical protein LC122_12900 [Chitinophagales bacterium]|nr:hypothetical protein [Chitinophagales bacterium]